MRPQSEAGCRLARHAGTRKSIRVDGGMGGGMNAGGTCASGRAGGRAGVGGRHGGGVCGVLPEPGPCPPSASGTTPRAWRSTMLATTFRFSGRLGGRMRASVGRHARFPRGAPRPAPCLRHPPPTPSPPVHPPEAAWTQSEGSGWPPGTFGWRRWPGKGRRATLRSSRPLPRCDQEGGLRADGGRAGGSGPNGAGRATLQRVQGGQGRQAGCTARPASPRAYRPLGARRRPR